MKYADDPFWKKLRWTLFIGFWLVWLGLLIAAVLIIIFSPKCPPKAKPLPHEEGLIYKVSTMSQ